MEDSYRFRCSNKYMFRTNVCYKLMKIFKTINNIELDINKNFYGRHRNKIIEIKK